MTKTLNRCDETVYSYDDGGIRAIKRGKYGEILYVNENYSVRNGDVASYHIFAGNTRVATAMKAPGADESVYYYHGDHLGSSSVVTNGTGAFHEGLEYFPYGETWVHDAPTAPGSQSMPYRFTSKEQDEETGLYYFGARYYDARLSKWISTDPALGKYLPGAGKGDDDLPGIGGVFNPVNMNVYHYGGNNPLIYIDPDGNRIAHPLQGLLSPLPTNPVYWVYKAGEQTSATVRNAGKACDYLGLRVNVSGFRLGGSISGGPLRLNFPSLRVINIDSDGNYYSSGALSISTINEKNAVGIFFRQYYVQGGSLNMNFSYNLGSDINNAFQLRNIYDYKNFELGYSFGAVLGIDIKWKPYTFFNNMYNDINNSQFINSFIRSMQGKGSGGSGFSIYFGREKNF
ncbi:MAG: RHS repeat-associated core domain-containing protein [Spirochaetes bacterium]|nr:RHS repeat-associated core domain-containing protein [Spirochaetota bacterium]